MYHSDDSETEDETTYRNEVKECSNPISYKVIDLFLEKDKNGVLAVYSDQNVIKIQFGANVETYILDSEGIITKKIQRNYNILQDYVPGDSIELDPLSWYIVISKIPRIKCTKEDNAHNAEKMLIEKAAFYLERYNKKRISKQNKLIAAREFLFSTLPFYKLLQTTYLEEKVKEYKVIKNLREEKDHKILAFIAEKIYTIARSYIITP